MVTMMTFGFLVCQPLWVVMQSIGIEDAGKGQGFVFVVRDGGG